jgi:hypothetical protein
LFCGDFAGNVGDDRPVAGEFAGMFSKPSEGVEVGLDMDPTGGAVRGAGEEI